MRTTPIFHAPDGMSNGRSETPRPSERREDHEFDHDDGLVHDHAWARTPDRTA